MVLGGNFWIRRIQRFLVTVDTYVCQSSAEVAVSVFSAVLGSTVGTCYASVLGWLLEEFHAFLREEVHSAPEVDSRVALP